MKAKIFKPTKTAMQSGKANTKKWVLEYEKEEKTFINPLIGWTGSGDMNQQIKMEFEEKDQAIAYAKKHNIDYEVIEPNESKLKIQQYADNFN